MAKPECLSSSHALSIAITASHPKEPLIPTEAPLYPFQMVAADYFEVGTRTHHYLVYVDRYSGWNRTNSR